MLFLGPPVKMLIGPIGCPLVKWPLWPAASLCFVGRPRATVSTRRRSGSHAPRTPGAQGSIAAHQDSIDWRALEGADRGARLNISILRRTAGTAR